MTRYKNLPAGMKFVINSVTILIFLAALFCAGMAVYAAIYDMSYSAAWETLIQALKGSK